MSKRKRQARLASVAVAVVAAIGPAVSGAGVAGAASMPKAGVRNYCAQLDEIGQQHGDPGIDAIFENNPDPTLAQWAAFLPGPVERMRSFADEIAATDPPKPVARDVAAAVRRLRAVARLFDGAQQAAADGDQEAFDDASDRRPKLVKKMMKSFNKVERACGSEHDGRE
jgi:hypothetical protein